MYKSILLALTLIYCINSNAQTAEAKASWVKQYPVTTASSETKGGTHNTFVNLYDQQIYFLDNKIHKYTHFANQVITAQGLEEVGKVEISFDPIYQKLHVHEVSILRGNKVINVLNNSKFEIIRKESELDQGIYNGVETAFILIKDLQLNDIVEYSYTIDGQNPIYDNRFFDVFTTQWTIPVGEFRLNLTVPKDLQLYFKYHKSTLEPKLKKSKHSKTYTWHKKNIQAMDYEGDYPRWYRPRAYFEISEFSDWNAVARWASDVFNINQNLDNNIRSQINEWLKDSRSDMEKIEKALKYVQENIRYMGIELGINSHQPRLPILTYETKFGDCKDKTVLLKALLHEMGIESTPALVSTNLNFGLKDRLPSPILFNHVILNLDLDTESYWLDATMNNQGTSLLNNSLPDYGYALLVDSDSQTLKKINRIDSQVNVKNSTETFSQNSKQQFDLNIKTIYQGEYAESWRQSIHNSNIHQLSKRFEAFYIRYYKNLKSTDTLQFQDQQQKNLLTIQENYQVEDLWSENGRYETLETYASGIAESVELPFRLNRSAPLYLDYPIDITHTFVIKQATDIIDTEQKPVAVKTNNISYHRTYENNGDSVIIKHHYKTLNDHVKVADLNKHFESLRAIRKSLSLVLIKKMAFEEKIKSSEDRLKNALRKMLEEKSQ